MACFHLLFLALAVVSVRGYDLNTRQQYLPIQTYPSQNGYAVVYSTPSQLPVRTYSLPTYPAYPYPANYAIPRQAYYTPYTYQYQPKDVTPKVTYPVRGYAVQQRVPSANEGQIYSSSYPYQTREASQQGTYPVVYITSQQEHTSQRQGNQGQAYSPSYPYQTKETSPKVIFPFRGYAAEQENAHPRQEQEYLHQTKETLPKVTLPVTGYLIQDQTYPYQTKDSIQKVTSPVQGYPEGSLNSHPYPGVDAARYPEGYYQTVHQGYPMKQEDASKNLLPNKPMIYVKYGANHGYPNQHIKEEVMQQNQKDSWVNDKDYEKNAINADRNIVY